MGATALLPEISHRIACAVTIGYINSIGPLLLTGFNFTPSMISNNIHHYEVWDEITYPFVNFNGSSVDVWEWIKNFTPHFAGHVIFYTEWDVN